MKVWHRGLYINVFHKRKSPRHDIKVCTIVQQGIVEGMSSRFGIKEWHLGMGTKNDISSWHQEKKNVYSN